MVALYGGASASSRGQLAQLPRPDEETRLVLAKPRPGPRPDQLAECNFVAAIANEAVQGSLFQRKACLLAAQQASAQQVEGEVNPVDEYLFRGRRPVSTLSARAGSSKPTPAEALFPQRLGAVLVECSGHLWNLLLEHIRSLVQDHGFEALILGRRRGYDESPYRLRVKEDDHALSKSKSTGHSPAIVKTLQTHLLAFALMRNLELVQGDVPVWLQVLESGSAEVLVQCEQRVEALISHYNSIAPLFSLNECLVCTDRYGGRTSHATRVQSALRPTTWPLCDPQGG